MRNTNADDCDKFENVRQRHSGGQIEEQKTRLPEWATCAYWRFAD